MEEKPREEFTLGNTTVIVHSNLVKMDKTQRREWFHKEVENGNPVLKEIAAAVEACYR